MPLWKQYGFESEAAFRARYPEVYQRRKSKQDDPLGLRDNKRVMSKQEHHRMERHMHKG